MSRASFEMASPYLPVDGRQVGGARRLPLVLCLGVGVASAVALVLLHPWDTGTDSGAEPSALGATPALVSQTVSGTYSLHVSLEYPDGTHQKATQEGYKTVAFDVATGRYYKRTQLRDGGGGEHILVTIEDPVAGRATFFANSSQGSHWGSTCESFPMTGPTWPPEWSSGRADRALRGDHAECLTGTVACERSRRAGAVGVPGDAAESLFTFRSVLHEDVWSEWPAGGRVPGSAKRKTEDVTWAQDARGALSTVRKRVEVELQDPEAFWNTSVAFARLAISAFNVTDAAVGALDAHLFELPDAWGPCTGGDDVAPVVIESRAYHT